MERADLAGHGLRPTSGTPHAAGWVRIALTATGLPPGEHCSVVVIARDGTEATAATWVVPQTGGQATTINGSASVPDNDIATIAIRDHAGTPLVAIPV
jgi:hypothetical protein